jgi:hypothetical protein
LFCTQTTGAIALRLGHLGGRDVAQADVADQPLALQLGQRRHLLGDGPLLGAVARTP